MGKLLSAFFALFMAVCPAAGEDDMTELDLAYMVLMENPAKQSFYNDVFLMSELFLPVSNPDQGSPQPAGRQSNIRPLFVESNGRAHLVIFDTKERMGAWANRKISFIKIQGKAIAGMMNPDIPWILNAGTKYEKVFSPEEIKQLKYALQ